MKKRISTIVVSLIIALVIFPNCRRTEHDKLTYFGVWAIMESPCMAMLQACCNGEWKGLKFQIPITSLTLQL